MKKIFIPIIPVLFFVQMHAQPGFTNNGNLQIHSLDSVSVSLPFTNTVNGRFINNGVLYIKGDITNSQELMASSSGSLHLDGSSAQSISGPEIFRTYNLITNNSSGISLNNSLSVGGVHNFTAGMITASSAPHYLIYEEGSSHSGTSDSRHVTGWVRKTGTTAFDFPVGNGTYLRSIAVANLSVLSVFDGHYEGVTTNNNNLQSPLVTVDQFEYWTVNRVSGGTAQITLNWNDSKINFPEYIINNIRVAEYSAGLWTSRGGTATGNVNTTGTITSAALSSFGPFTFGSIDFALPLHFINISAKRNETYTLVQWKTEQEFNVDHFEIERRDNLNNTYVKVGTAKPHNTIGPHTYQFSDYADLNGDAFYRIRSVDIDGKISYSGIATVSDRNSNGLYRINNPVVNTIHLYTDDSYKGSYRYELISSAGQTVQTGQLTIASAGTISIPLTPSVLKGNYILKIRNGSHQITEKIMVK